MTLFSSFQLSESIITALDRMEYRHATEIQAEAIPVILEGKDLIALARTGSGKTAACAIPLCNKIDTSCPLPQVLVVVPTRELALQYATEAQKIGKCSKIQAFALFGGEDYAIQKSKLQHGVHFLVATPGRLIDLIHSRDIDLTKVSTLVLDEADEMLSMGFYEDLEFIMQCLVVRKPQLLLFSATMPPQIRKIAKTHMNEPVEICQIPKQASPEAIDHFFVFCHHRDKMAELSAVIKQLEPHQAIVFCRSRSECETVCHGLKKTFPSVDYLHAGQSQDVRTIVTGKFRAGKIRLLVATDVASRGLDFSGVTHVFIYHLASDSDLYLHRSGRTGRYDQKGVVVTLVTDRELETQKQILQRIDRPAQWIGEAPIDVSGGTNRRQQRSHSPGASNSNKRGKAIAAKSSIKPRDTIDPRA